MFHKNQKIWIAAFLQDYAIIVAKYRGKFRYVKARMGNDKFKNKWLPVFAMKIEVTESFGGFILAHLEDWERQAGNEWLNNLGKGSLKKLETQSKK